MSHLQFFATPREAISKPGCLHEDKDHGGRCYTLVERVNQGYGESFYCARPRCDHDATWHTDLIGKPTGRATQVGPCQKCGCQGWVEPVGDSDYKVKRVTEDHLSRDHGHRLGVPDHESTDWTRLLNLGVGPDAPTVTEANGAKQSAAAGAFTSIDPLVMFQVAQVQQYGDDKYGPDNWRRLPEKDHINHALAHVYADLAGDESDPHLAHAVVRLMFALAVRLRPDYYGRDAVTNE